MIFRADRKPIVTVQIWDRLLVTAIASACRRNRRLGTPLRPSGKPLMRQRQGDVALARPDRRLGQVQSMTSRCAWRPQSSTDRTGPAKDARPSARRPREGRRQPLHHRQADIAIDRCRLGAVRRGSVSCVEPAAAWERLGDQQPLMRSKQLRRPLSRSPYRRVCKETAPGCSPRSHPRHCALDVPP